MTEGGYRLSRKGFLFSSSLLIMAGALGRYQLDDLLEDPKFIDRRRVFEELIAKKDMPNGMDALIAWLKFSASEMYAKRLGWVFSETTISHFLDKSGQLLNPTKEMAQSLTRFGTGYLPLEEDLPEPVAWNIFARDTLSEVFKSSEPHIHHLSLTPTKDGIRRLLVSGKAFEIQFKGVSVAGNKDIGYSLAYHSVEGVGIVEKSQQVNGGWDVSGSNFKLTLKDKYDWDATHDDVGVSLDELIYGLMNSFGIRNPRTFVVNNLGEEASRALFQTPLIYDGEGALLEQMGYAKSYEMITDRIDVQGRVSFHIPSKSLNNSKSL